MAISDWPAHLQPRKKMLRSGATSLTDAELLAIFLQTGRKGKSAVDLAFELLAEFNSIHSLLNANLKQIRLKGIGEAKFSMLRAALELGHRYLEEEVKTKLFFSGAQDAKPFLISKLCRYRHEVFSCIFLSSTHYVLAYKELFHGTIDNTPIYARVIAQTALELNAAAVIFAHNHPSGDSKPSHTDIKSTKELACILRVLDIRVLDHIVVGGPTGVSLAEEGLFSPSYYSN